jgi:hypothetical protein
LRNSLTAFAAMAFSFSVMAQTPSQTVEQFCVDRGNASFAKTLMRGASNLMAFANRGGIANGGVCWWNSRFQRNAHYTTLYNPQKKKPTSVQAAKLIAQIRDGKGVIEIPGYRNFSEFSYSHQREIQRELEKWQKGDGIIKFNWVIGLSGDTVVSAEKLSDMMNELYDYVEVQGNIAYQKLQIKGVTAHAWLVKNMKKTTNGYELEVLDSNYPHRTNIYYYRKGQKSFRHQYYGEFTPYLERKGEMDQLVLSIMKTCEPEKWDAKMAEERRAREVSNNNNY